MAPPGSPACLLWRGAWGVPAIWVGRAEHSRSWARDQRALGGGPLGEAPLALPAPPHGPVFPGSGPASHDW